MLRLLNFTVLLFVFSAFSLSEPVHAEEKNHDEKNHKASLVPVTLQLSYVIAGQHAPYAYGIVKGLYAQEGIELKLAEGKGSGAVVQTIAEDKARFGQLDANTAAINISKGSPIKVVASYMYATPFGLIFLAKNGYRNIKDLAGKKIGMVKNEAPDLLLEAYLKANGMSLSDFVRVEVDPKEKLKSLAEGKIDLAGYNTFSKGAVEKEIGHAIGAFRYASNLPLPGDVFIVNTKYLATPEGKDLNCRMLRATAKSMAGALANSQEAVNAVHQLFPQANKGAKQVTEDGWLKTAETVTARRMQKPPGFTYEEDWSRMLGILKGYKAIDEIKPLETYFTNDLADCMK